MGKKTVKGKDEGGREGTKETEEMGKGRGD